MDSRRGSADGVWPRPGLKALSTLSLGIYNSRTRPSTSIFKSHKSFEHTIYPFEPVAAENLRINPNPQHLLESLKVCMMNLGPAQQIPLQQNYAVNVLLETLGDTFREENAKDKQVEAEKAEANEALNHLEEQVQAWNILEADYKKELRSLEVLVAGGQRGLQYVTLARTNSDLKEHREEFRKTTSNLSSVTTSGKVDGNGSESKNHKEEFRKTTSNLSSVTISGKVDENAQELKTHGEGGTARSKVDDDGSTRQEAKTMNVLSSNQVFDHKRTSRPPNDKLFADFGTILDSELSKTIQESEDALAGAAKQRWLEARRLAGHTGLSSPSSSDEKGLGLTIYDRPTAPSFHAPLPPPIIVEPKGDDNSGEDEDDDDGEELTKIPGGGYMMKPPKKHGTGGPAKSFFGLGKKKVLEFQNSDSSSASSSDSDDRGPRGIARAIASAHFMATIASPMIGMEQAISPPKTAGGLQPPKHTFKNKKKTSYTNLPAMAQHFIHGIKKDSSPKPVDLDRSKQSTRPNIKYDKAVAQLQSIMLLERRAFSEALKSSMNAPPFPPGYRGRENMLQAMGDQASHKLSMGPPSDRGKIPKAQRSVSSLRHEYIPDDHNEENVPTYGKSNSVRGSFEERRTDQGLSLPYTTSSLGLGIVAKGQTKGDSHMPPQPPELHPYADGGFARIHPRPVASDRGYDPRIRREPSPVRFDHGLARTGGSDQQREPVSGRKVLVDRVKSYQEERAEVEAASRRLLMRASGHKFNDTEQASWDQGPPRRETFHESVIRRQRGAYQGGHRPPPSAGSVVTAFYNSRESILGDDHDDHLIRGRSDRGGRSDALASLTANAGSSRREAAPGRTAPQNTMPYSLSLDALESIRERDEEIANSRRMERGSTSSITSSIASSCRRRKSIRGKENFLASLRNAMLPLKSKFGRKAGEPGLPGTVSATGLSEENAKVSKRDAFPVVVPPRHPYADWIDTSRRESDTSGEGQHSPPRHESAITVRKSKNSIIGDDSSGSRSRPVTAIYQGLQTSHARPFSFTPADERQFSASTKQVVHPNPKNMDTPARSWRNPIGGSEKRVISIETARDSLEIIRLKASGLDGRSSSGRPPSPFFAGDWRKASSDEFSSDEYDSDASPSRVPIMSLEDMRSRREVSRQSSGAEQSRVDSTAPTTALTYQDRDDSPKTPQRPKVEDAPNTLRPGGSSQAGMRDSRMSINNSTSEFRKSMAKTEASADQGLVLNSPFETAKVTKKPIHDRVVRTSSTGSIITVVRQNEPEPAPTPPPKGRNEPTKQLREGSGQRIGSGSRMPNSESRSSLSENGAQRKYIGQQSKPLKSPTETAKELGTKLSRDGVVRTSSTGSIITIVEQKQPNQPPPPPPKLGSKPSKQHREASAQHSKDGNARTPSGPKPRGNMGQILASGGEKRTANMAVNPALAAARSVVEAAAKKKLAEEAKKKRK